jgi:hypothetical protein
MKTLEIEGREHETIISQERFGYRHDISGLKLVTPIDIVEGKDGKHIEYRGGKYGFWDKGENWTMKKL